MYPGMGSGYIALTKKTFCSGDTCKDLRVCWFADQGGKSVFYLPVNGKTNISKLKVQKLSTTSTPSYPWGKMSVLAAIGFSLLFLEGLHIV